MMKRRIAYLLAVLIMLLITACGGKQITMDEAKEIALKDAGKTASEVSFISESMDKKSSASDTEFHMTFVSESGKWEYKINGKGEILQKSMELSEEEFNQIGLVPESTIAAPQAATTAAKQETTTAATQETTVPVTEAGTSAAPQQTTIAASQAATESIGLEGAKTLALKDAGKTASEVTFTKTKEDREVFGIEYEIEFYTGDAKYEYNIAQDGAVTKKKVEPFAVQGQSTAGKALTLDEARALVLSDAGVNAADVIFTEAKTDIDDGITKYEFEFISGRTKWEYEVNAANGQILKAEKEG